MKTIIALTDFSESANVALNYAARLAHNFQARLLVYHSFAVPMLATEVPLGLPEPEELAAENMLRLNEIRDKFLKEYHVEVEPVTDAMPLEDSLPGLVYRKHADLVIIGMWGSNGFERRIFGSTAIFVLSNAHYPVLVVPEGVHFHEPKNILFAWNQDVLLPVNKLAVLRDLAVFYQATIHVVHVKKPGQEHAKYGPLEELLKGIDHKYELIENTNIAKAIEDKVKEYKPDLLVMIPKEHGYWLSLKENSTTHKVAYNINIPLLALPNPLHR